MNVMVILVGHRRESAIKMQHILTEHGDVIRTRLGINRQLTNNTDATGFIFLELCEDEARVKDLHDELNRLEEVKAEVLKMELPGLEPKPGCSCGCSG
ncbi:MAG: hypothetical protein ACM3QZ_09270 [Solirubrobacterales bacterium]